MAEFVALVALGVLVVGLGVLFAASLLTALGWLVVHGIQHIGPDIPATGDGGHRPPRG